MKSFLVGVLKKNQMRHLFGKHSESLCDYSSITLEEISGTAYVALFRLENNHFECHTLDDIESWFSKGKSTLPNTRAKVTEADINRVYKFYEVMNPPPPPPSHPPPPSPPPPPRSPRRSPSISSSPNDRFRFVTTRRGSQRRSPQSGDRYRFVTTRRGSRR
tara:strand:+ start:5376 stop:5858 length:483 start_codon:yes stop_codon:yes gene_type:complete